jgi:hypothetical protein
MEPMARQPNRMKAPAAINKGKENTGDERKQPNAD